jgi:hypothetical protein
VRTVTAFAVAIAIAVPVVCFRATLAQETIVMDDSGMDAGPSGPGACGCRNRQAPPWHGNVAGDPCGPSCPRPTMFHANPCEQLWMKHNARQQGYMLPPHFPRMHGRLADGSWPTPRPISTPRCPNCGVHIEHGM